MGKYSVFNLGILPPFGRADTVDLERNISPYCPPSIAIIIMYCPPSYIIYNIIDNFCACAITICTTRIACIYSYDSMI